MRAGDLPDRAVTAAARARPDLRVTEIFGLGFRHPMLMRPLQSSRSSISSAPVPDPVLRAELTPNYTLGCKRILFSNHWLPAVVGERRCRHRRHRRGAGALNRDQGRARARGRRNHLRHRIPRHRHSLWKIVRGREGRTLDEVWNGSPRRISASPCPASRTCCCLGGAGSTTGHNSHVFQEGSQVAYAMDALRLMRARGITSIEARAGEQRAYTSSSRRGWGARSGRQAAARAGTRTLAAWPRSPGPPRPGSTAARPATSIPPPTRCAPPGWRPAAN